MRIDYCSPTFWSKAAIIYGVSNFVMTARPVRAPVTVIVTARIANAAFRALIHSNDELVDSPHV